MRYALAYCAPDRVTAEARDLNYSIYLDLEMANLTVGALKTKIEEEVRNKFNIDDTVSAINFTDNIMEDGINLDLTKLDVEVAEQLSAKDINPNKEVLFIYFYTTHVLYFGADMPFIPGQPKPFPG